MTIIPVILAGGVGTRLWPLSRELYPKQLLPLLGQKTLLQETLQRVEKWCQQTAVIVVCNEEHRFIVAEQLREQGVDRADILLEPVGRNTAPACTIAALHAQNIDADSLILVLPADHHIADAEKFNVAVESGALQAAEARLVTFGVVPDRPETGYGYIQQGQPVNHGSGFAVRQFIEKPSLGQAKHYLDEGGYYWNSGMFLFRAETFLQQVEKHAPEIFSQCKLASSERVMESDFIRIDHDAFTACPSDSIDYAIMEKAGNGVVIPLETGWNDVGAWSALWDLDEKDDNGNVRIGNIFTENVNNCYIRGESKIIAAVGLTDCVVVDTTDAVLVAAKDQVQHVKAIVGQLKASERPEVVLHRKVYRPWGSYEGVDQGERFQVKRITVKPGASLSLQMHHHRAEHWIVVSGTARVTRGDETFSLTENESTYIPLETLHRLENPGKIPLKLIEIQSGNYLGEDDIVRFEDDYGRDQS